MSDLGKSFSELCRVFACDAVPPDAIYAASGATLDPRGVSMSVDESVTGEDATWRVTIRVERGALTFLDAAKLTLGDP